MQTSYSINTPAANPGVLYDLEHSVIRSYAVDTNPIGFGLACVAGTNVNTQVKIPSASGQLFRGVSVKSDEYPNLNAGAVGYSANQELPVLRRGPIWVQASGAVTQDQPVYFNVTTGQFGPAAPPALTGTFTRNAGSTGNFTCSAVTATAGTALAGLYIATFTDATHYTLINPHGDFVASGTTGVAFNSGGMAFTITAGSTPAIEGDGFQINVTAAAATVDQVPTGVWLSTTTGAGLALMEINIP